MKFLMLRTFLFFMELTNAGCISTNLYFRIPFYSLKFTFPVKIASSKKTALLKVDLLKLISPVKMKFTSSVKIELPAISNPSIVELDISIDDCIIFALSFKPIFFRIQFSLVVGWADPIFLG